MASNDVQRISARDRWDDTPAAWKWGVVVGIVGWFVAFSDSSVTTVNGAITSCTYLDYAKIGLGVLTVAFAVAGFAAHARAHRRLPAPVALVIAAALVADGVLLVLTGIDLIAAVCPV